MFFLARKPHLSLYKYLKATFSQEDKSLKGSDLLSHSSNERGLPRYLRPRFGTSFKVNHQMSSPNSLKDGATNFRYQVAFPF